MNTVHATVVMLSVILFIGCAELRNIPKHYILCKNANTSEKVQQVKTILIDNDFIIKTDKREIELYKYMYAVSADNRYRWRIQLEEKGIRALCSDSITLHADYLDDNTDKSVASYWSVRNGIELICDGKPYIEKKKHDAPTIQTVPIVKRGK